ncbi:hypothetical protein PENSPDRAFT_92698 [Peniophora sp. CONT]|nr:hypothetical protein PENSPDRAFT_92698 [Peniophora sp. CONT]
MTRSLVDIAERVTIHTVHPSTMANVVVCSMKRLLLFHSGYQTSSIHLALRSLVSVSPSELTELCIAAPLPVLLTLENRLPPVETLMLAIITQTKECTSPPPEDLPWARLEKLMDMLVSFGRSRRVTRAVQLTQCELAARIRQELANRSRELIVNNLQESPIDVLDEQGLSLITPFLAQA